MHYWTAPGSIRGAVDFIGAGGRSWNLADFFIIGATPPFLLAAACLARRAALSRVPEARASSAAHPTAGRMPDCLWHHVTPGPAQTERTTGCCPQAVAPRQ